MSGERLSGVLLEALGGGDQWQDVEVDEPGSEDLEEGVGFSSPLWGGATALMRVKDSIDKFRATVERMGRPGRIGGLADLEPSVRQEVETVDKEAKSLERQLVALHDSMVRVAGRAKKLDRAVTEETLHEGGAVPWEKGQEADDAIQDAYRYLMALAQSLQQHGGKVPRDLRILNTRLSRALQYVEEARKAVYDVKALVARVRKLGQVAA